jgi:hypothetical protein
MDEEQTKQFNKYQNMTYMGFLNKQQRMLDKGASPDGEDEDDSPQESSADEEDTRKPTGKGE